MPEGVDDDRIELVDVIVTKRLRPFIPVCRKSIIGSERALSGLFGKA